MGMFSEFLVETKHFRFKEKSEIGVRKGSLFSFGKKQEEIPKSYQEVCKSLFSDSEKIWLGIFFKQKEYPALTLRACSSATAPMPRRLPLT